MPSETAIGVSVCQIEGCFGPIRLEDKKLFEDIWPLTQKLCLSAPSDLLSSSHVFSNQSLTFFLLFTVFSVQFFCNFLLLAILRLTRINLLPFSVSFSPLRLSVFSFSRIERAYAIEPKRSATQKDRRTLSPAERIDARAEQELSGRQQKYVTDEFPDKHHHIDHQLIVILHLDVQPTEQRVHTAPGPL